MPSWKIYITGDEFALKEYVSSPQFKSPQLTINSDENGIYIHSSSFLSSDTEKDIEEKAQYLFQQLNGASVLCWSNPRLVQISHVCLENEDGTSHAYVKFCDEIRITEDVFITMTDQDGNIIEELRQSDSIVNDISFSNQNTSMNRILQLVEHEGLSDWGNLFRIAEVIETDLGGQRQLNKIFNDAKVNKHHLFRHHANNPETTGLDSRHGTTKCSSPQIPMSIREAKSHIIELITEWKTYRKRYPLHNV